MVLLHVIVHRFNFATCFGWKWVVNRWFEGVQIDFATWIICKANDSTGPLKQNIGTIGRVIIDDNIGIL